MFILSVLGVCKGCADTTVVYSFQRDILIPVAERTVQKGVDIVLTKPEEVSDFKCPKCCTEGLSIKLKSWQFYVYPKVLTIVVDR